MSFQTLSYVAAVLNFLVVYAVAFYLTRRIKEKDSPYHKGDDSLAKRKFSDAIHLASAIRWRNSSKLEDILAKAQHLKLPKEIPLLDLGVVWLAVFHGCLGLAFSAFIFVLESLTHMDCVTLSWWEQYDEGTGSGSRLFQSIGNLLSSIFC